MTESESAVTEPQGYRNQNRSEVLKLLPPLREGMKILEVGCGEGAFTGQLAGPIETWGIEPDKRSAGIASKRLTRVLCCLFEQAKTELPERYFDLVVCNDVIEHMTDHDAFLRQIKAFMAPGAHLVGSLPNVRFYRNLFDLIVSRDWHYQDSGILDRTHLRFFTFRSWRRTLESAGYEIRRMEGLNELRPRGWDTRTIVERAFRQGMILLSAGFARDINFLQIGFLAAPRETGLTPSG